MLALLQLCSLGLGEGVRNNNEKHAGDVASCRDRSDFQIRGVLSLTEGVDFDFEIEVGGSNLDDCAVGAEGRGIME